MKRGEALHCPPGYRLAAECPGCREEVRNRCGTRRGGDRLCAGRSSEDRHLNRRAGRGNYSIGRWPGSWACRLSAVPGQLKAGAAA